MRLKLSRFRRNFNKDLPIEFTEQNLSSFGGLELFSRYLRRVELSRRVGKACRGKGIRSDYGSVRLVLVLVGMLLVGARRLEHLQYVCDDPMLLRFCGLSRLPSRPTIVNWLKQFTGERLKGLSELNGVLVHEQVERLGLNRLTVDMDGTVVQAGNQVGWAFRGFNPHRKKNKSFYPLFAHLAQTGQILKSRNRPGNVHDSKGADAFLRELIGELRGQFGRSRKLEFRTDAAFFNEKILKNLHPPPDRGGDLGLDLRRNEDLPGAHGHAPARSEPFPHCCSNAVSRRPASRSVVRLPRDPTSAHHRSGQARGRSIRS